MRGRYNPLRSIMSIMEHRPLFLLVIFAISISAQSSNRKWETSDDGQIKWSENCEFLGGDIGIKKGILTLTKCQDICLADKRCTYFTYNFYGTCSLKVLEPENLERSLPNEYFNPSCGYVIDRVKLMQRDGDMKSSTNLVTTTKSVEKADQLQFHSTKSNITPSPMTTRRLTLSPTKWATRLVSMKLTPGSKPTPRRNLPLITKWATKSKTNQRPGPLSAILTTGSKITQRRALMPTAKWTPRTMTPRPSPPATKWTPRAMTSRPFLPSTKWTPRPMNPRLALPPTKWTPRPMTSHLALPPTKWIPRPTTPRYNLPSTKWNWPTKPIDRARFIQSYFTHSSKIISTTPRPTFSQTKWTTSTITTVETTKTSTTEPSTTTTTEQTTTTIPRKWFDHEDDRGQLKWSFNCDYIGNDIKLEFDTPKEECSSHCLRNPKCNHFAWFNNDCHLKRAKLKDNIKLSNNAISTERLCGYILTRKNKEVSGESSRNKTVSSGGASLNVAANDTHFLPKNQNSSGVGYLLK